MNAKSLSSAEINPSTTTRDGINIKQILLFFAAHIPLGLVMSRFELIATGHALLTIGLGLIWALQGKTERTLYAAAYIVGAEVLWRMSSANVFWEMGKYAVIAIFVITLLQNRHFTIPALPAFYFLLLIPSSLLTLNALPLSEARQQISFTLSGPLSLMIAVVFFSQVRITRTQLQQVFLMLAAPVTGILAVTMFSTITADTIRFTGESNFITSGGFGPNQVSSALSAGALVLFFSWLEMRGNKRLQNLIFGLMLAMVIQSVLTFSRGGVYLFILSVIAALFFLARDRTARLRVLVFGGGMFLLGWLVIVPWLDTFTQGYFSTRFQDASLTGRDLIFQADIRIWKDNPLGGVGPGMSTPLHALTFISAAAHTEFSRMLAEHGVLGLISFLMFLAMVSWGFLNTSSSHNQAIVSALLVWVLAFTIANAMRLALPGFFFGLALNYSFREPPGAM
jgi:O-antigen ligase